MTTDIEKDMLLAQFTIEALQDAFYWIDKANSKRVKVAMMYQHFIIPKSSLSANQQNGQF